MPDGTPAAAPESPTSPVPATPPDAPVAPDYENDPIPETFFDDPDEADAGEDATGNEEESDAPEAGEPEPAAPESPQDAFDRELRELEARVSEPSEGAPAQTPPEPDSRGAESLPATPGSITERWAEVRKGIEANWKDADGQDYDGFDGEKRLVGFVDQLAGEVERLRGTEEARIEAEHAALANRAANMAVETATAIKERYGLDVHPVAILGAAQNGGLAALAAINGIRIEDLAYGLTADTLLQAFELKHGARLAKGTPKAKTRPEPKPAFRELGTAGSARDRRVPQTDEEIFDAAMAESRTAAGAGN